MLRVFIFIFFNISIFHLLLAQNQPKKEYYAGECSKNELSIDGKLNELAWDKAN
jgi:hypothetical protein